jgi:hypothetical protein
MDRHPMILLRDKCMFARKSKMNHVLRFFFTRMSASANRTCHSETWADACIAVVVIVEDDVVRGDARCCTGGGEAQPLTTTTGSGSVSAMGGCKNDEKRFSSSCGNNIGG